MGLDGYYGSDFTTDLCVLSMKATVSCKLCIIVYVYSVHMFSSLFIITSVKEVMILAPCVNLSVCIRNSCFNFGCNLDHCLDQGIFYRIFFVALISKLLEVEVCTFQVLLFLLCSNSKILVKQM